MRFDRRQVIKIATAEVGYLEKSTAAYKKDPGILDQKTAGAGYDNWTKYGRDMHRIYPSVMDLHAAWCNSFVDWCFYRAYGVATAKNLLGGNYDDYTVASAQMYAKHGALDKKPEVGAQIFFTRNGAVSGCYHTGLVIAVASDGKTVTTIEGNTSATGSGIEANGGCVAKKVRNVNAYTLFGHPAYNDKTNASDKTSDKTSASDKACDKTEAAKHYERAEAGTYYVCTKSDPLMMRVGAGTNRKIITRVPKGGKVQCYGYYNLDKDGVTKWLYCVYNNHRGYLCRTYLRRVQA
jgi:hypothetical protein